MGEASQQWTYRLGFAAFFAIVCLWLSTRSSRVAEPHRRYEVSISSSMHEGYRPVVALPVSAWPRPPRPPPPPPPPPPPLPAWRTAWDEDDPWASSSLRKRPEVRAALADALRAAMREADHNSSADPLELLATRLLQRRAIGVGMAPPRPPPPPPAPGNPGAAATTAADGGGGGSIDQFPECRGRARARRRCRRAAALAQAATAAGNGTRPLLPYPPPAARQHGLPPKLPTAAMWPPLRRPIARDGATEGGGSASARASTAPDFRSLGRVAPYRGGDLERPGELAKAAAARAYKGELILTYGNEVSDHH